MSFGYNTYVGPYVRCAVEMVDVTETRKTCSNLACSTFGHYDDNAFCSECGAPVRELPFSKRDHAVDSWDVSEAINERLTTAHGDAYERWSIDNSAHLWKPNTGGIGRHLDSRADFYLAEITPAELMREVARFTEHFSTDLDTLRQHYGAAAVSIHWGVIQDYL